MKEVPQIFDGISKRFLKMISQFKSPSIDIVFDQYFTPSIKDCERLRRNETTSTVSIGPNQIGHHNFAGCDYTPAFFRKGILRPFKPLEKSVEYQLACQEIITDDDDELERIFATLENFICHMYGVPKSSNVNDVRFYLFSKTYQSKELDDNFEKKCRSFDSSSLPPCKAELYQHLLRMRCQVIYSQFCLAIHPNDHQARRRFVEWAQNEIAVVPDFHKRILFSDEAHFWLNGYVNKQNCLIWSEANPQVHVETPLHPEKPTVWCALWAGGILLKKR
ncbi:uncharacterized protein TNCV_5080891 [Trichonephila clavipes]|nr:uncharacterized protein TNCV_5080891 [Trichonephila clavipes]